MISAAGKTPPTIVKRTVGLRPVRRCAESVPGRRSAHDPVTPSKRPLPAGAIEALALCDAHLPVRLSLPPCSSHARGEPVATVRALPACAARCFCRHAADSAHSPWPEPCTFLRLCVALLRSEGMHRRLQDPVSMREEGVHRTFDYLPPPLRTPRARTFGPITAWLLSDRSPLGRRPRPW